MDNTQLELPSRKTRRAVVGITMFLCWLVIFYIINCGNEENSLHTSALAWAFGLNGATLFAYVFGSVMDLSNLTKS